MRQAFKLSIIMAIAIGLTFSANTHKANQQTKTKQDKHYTIDTFTAAHHFKPIGTLIPASGHAHLIYKINITEIEAAATQLIDSAFHAIDKHRMIPEEIRWAMQYTAPQNNEKLPDFVPYIPAAYPNIFPPGPTDYLLPGRFPYSIKETGKSAQDAYFFVNKELQQELATANGQWIASGKFKSLTFPKYLETSHKDLVTKVFVYLHTHKGPYLPKTNSHDQFSVIKPPSGKVDIQVHHCKKPNRDHCFYSRDANPVTDSNFKYLPMSAILKELSQVRLQVSILSDLSKPITDISANPRAFYGVSAAYWPHKLQGFSLPGKRSKRDVISSVFTRFGEATESFVCTLFGYYTSHQVRHLLNSYDQRSLQRDKLLAHEISANHQRIDKLTKAVEWETLFITESARYSAFNRITSYITSQLESLRGVLDNVLNIIDAMNAGKPSAALLSQFDMVQDIQALYAMAQEQGQRILVNTFSDIMQCPTTFTMENGVLRLIIHIPIANEREQLDLLSFTPYPFMLKDTTGLPYVFAQVDHADHILAVNKEKNLYKALTPAQLNNCVKETNTYLCHSGSILHTYNHADPQSIAGSQSLLSKSVDHCLFAILIGRPDIAKKACNLLLKPPSTQIRQADPFEFHITTFIKDTKGTITCGHNYQETFLVPHSFRLTMKPSCTADLLGYRLKTGDSLLFKGAMPKLAANQFDLSANINLSTNLLAQIKQITMEADTSTPTVLESVIKQLEQEEQIFLNMTPQQSAMASFGSVTLVIVATAAIAIYFYCKCNKKQQNPGTSIHFSAQPPNNPHVELAQAPLLQDNPPVYSPTLQHTPLDPPRKPRINFSNIA